MTTAKLLAALRCQWSTDLRWPGHSASLKHKRCKNRTLNPSGYCHLHRPRTESDS